MSERAERRRVVNAHTTLFLPYDLEGPVQPEMSWSHSYPTLFGITAPDVNLVPANHGWPSEASTTRRSNPVPRTCPRTGIN